MLGGDGGGTLNTITPCAACKLLRRRCAQECPFSPYFSPHEPQKFASVHRVFGASNVSKMLMVIKSKPSSSLTHESIIFNFLIKWYINYLRCMLFLLSTTAGSSRKSKSRCSKQSSLRGKCKAKRSSVRMHGSNFHFTTTSSIFASRTQRSKG